MPRRPKVVQLRPGVGEVPVLQERAAKRPCWHKTFELETESRRVYCQECGEEVDAFTAMLEFTKDFARYANQRDHLRVVVAAATEELERLQRLERNAKARKRRREAQIDIEALPADRTRHLIFNGIASVLWTRDVRLQPAAPEEKLNRSLVEELAEAVLERVVRLAKEEA